MKRWRRRLLPLIPLVPAAALVYLLLTARSAEPESDVLHRDDHIRRLAPHDIACATRAARSIFDIPRLDVVPDGESRPRGEVFRALGLDDRHVGELRIDEINRVYFLSWQVSPSFTLVCMAAIDEDEPNAPALTDPARPVYGVRLVSRADVDEMWVFGWVAR